jgi:hypothetical protein
MNLDGAAPVLQTSVEETIEAISRVRADQHASATRHQRVFDNIT